ncbi:MAG: hypothetical protein J0L86_06610 [Flavobacteriales bacterium]|nr:hypothetical protein [Flavobacteriales bacterium]
MLKIAPIEWKACEVRTTWKESGKDDYKKAQAICFQKKLRNIRSSLRRLFL